MKKELLIIATVGKKLTERAAERKDVSEMLALGLMLAALTSLNDQIDELEKRTVGKISAN